jgi:hypothetical protein
MTSGNVVFGCNIVMESNRHAARYAGNGELAIAI